MINNTKKLLLINPWQTYRKDLESEYQSYLPYGLACIGSIGINKGFETKIVDCLEDDTRAEFDEFIRFGKTNDELYSLITDFAPNIVGISSTFSMFENDATEIAKLVKSINPKIIVILPIFSFKNNKGSKSASFVNSPCRANLFNSPSLKGL